MPRMMIVTMMQWVMMVTVVAGNLGSTSPGNMTANTDVPSNDTDVRTEPVTSLAHLDNSTPHSGPLPKNGGQTGFPTTPLGGTTVQSAYPVETGVIAGKPTIARETSTAQIDAAEERSSLDHNVSTSNIGLSRTLETSSFNVSDILFPPLNSTSSLSSGISTGNATAVVVVDGNYSTLTTVKTPAQTSSLDSSERNSQPPNSSAPTANSTASPILSTRSTTRTIRIGAEGYNISSTVQTLKTLPNSRTSDVPSGNGMSVGADVKPRSSVVPRNQLPTTVPTSESNSTFANPPLNESAQPFNNTATSETVTKPRKAVETTTKPQPHVSTLVTVRQGTKTTTGTSTDDVTDQFKSTDNDDREYGNEGPGVSDYERSLQTRRVINHAALWITIGFVVVLVSYITALLIYNRTRPDWHDPQRPYSRFENEAEDEDQLPESDANNVGYNDEEFTPDFPQHENRRDFSQCVDSRDFPSCDESSEFLLYEERACSSGQSTFAHLTYQDEC